jgi:hypothetical protein
MSMAVAAWRPRAGAARFILATAAAAALCGPVAAQTCRVADPRNLTREAALALGESFDPGVPRAARLQIGGNVTDIVRIVNHTSCRIRLEKRDRAGLVSTNEMIEVPPAGTFQGHMWVPWRTRHDAQEEISVVIANRGYFEIWQQGGYLKFETTAHFQGFPGASSQDRFEMMPRVPGLSIEGGPRILHVALAANGKPFFRFEGVGEP